MRDPQSPVVQLEGVTRWFGRKVALNGIDLELAPGRVMGLIGRNGSGKTTTLRLALGLLYPDRGSMRVLGLDPRREGRAVRMRASLLSEEDALYPWMTVEELLQFAARTHPRWDSDLSADLVEKLQLVPQAKIRTLSRGTRAKVGLVVAVACRPELLLLDDPTAGLDPLVRREVLEGILATVAAEGGSVIYASHLIHDVERIADEVVVLDGGRIRMSGEVHELKASLRQVTAVFEEAVPADVALPGGIDARVDGRSLRVVAECGGEELERVLREQGAKEIVKATLPLEEILVALLRGDDAREEAR